MKNYKKYIFTGIVSLVPLMITYWIVQYLFIFFTIPGKALITRIFDFGFVRSPPLMF